MTVFERTTRFAAIVLAVLFTGLSLFCIFGAWLVNRKATEVALNGFGVIERGVRVVNSGVERVDGLIATSRTEVEEVAGIIANFGAQTQANGSVLNTLNERLEASLAPRIAQIQQALTPVRDAVGTVSTAVSLMNSLPMMADRAPRLEALDQAFARLQELSADATHLRGTLRTLTAAQKTDVPSETVTTLSALANRIDTRLGEVRASLQGVQADISALQTRLDRRKSRALFVFNLLAVLSTLMLTWIVYAQVVVIRHHRARMRRAPDKASANGPVRVGD